MPTERFTLLADKTLLTVFEQSDVIDAAFTARTQKYQVPAASPVTVSLVAVALDTALVWASAVALVP
jgi:hypothetical protein